MGSGDPEWHYGNIQWRVAMSSYHEIASADERELIGVDPMDDAMPAGSGFLMVVCGSLLFWLFVLLLFSAF